MEDIQKYIKNQLVNQENENFEGAMEYLFGAQNNMMVSEGLIKNLAKKFWKWIKSFNKSKMAKQFDKWAVNSDNFNFHKIDGTNVALSNVICIPFLKLHDIILKLTQLKNHPKLSFLLFNIFYKDSPNYISADNDRNEKRCHLLDNTNFKKYCPLDKIKVLINFITDPTNKSILHPAGICIYIPLEDVDIKTLEKERGIKFPNELKKYLAILFISPISAASTVYNDRLPEHIRDLSSSSLHDALKYNVQNLLSGGNYAYIDYLHLITSEEYKK